MVICAAVCVTAWNHFLALQEVLSQYMVYIYTYPVIQTLSRACVWSVANPAVSIMATATILFILGIITGIYFEASTTVVVAVAVAVARTRDRWYAWLSLRVCGHCAMPAACCCAVCCKVVCHSSTAEILMRWVLLRRVACLLFLVLIIVYFSELTGGLVVCCFLTGQSNRQTTDRCCR